MWRLVMPSGTTNCCSFPVNENVTVVGSAAWAGAATSVSNAAAARVAGRRRSIADRVAISPLLESVVTAPVHQQRPVAASGDSLEIRSGPPGETPGGPWVETRNGQFEGSASIEKRWTSAAVEYQ